MPALNIPIEILRTTLAVAELGTYSKAATRLGISQPGVSAQMKRLQQIVGGDVFLRDVGGSVLTPLGQTVLVLARKVIDAHDQILRLGVSAVGPERVRLGMSPLLVGRLMNAQTSPAELANVFVRTGSSENLMRDVVEGRLDIACCFSVGELPQDAEAFVVAQKQDDLVWVRSSTFVLSPGKPIPIVSWRGDDWLTAVLSRKGLSYQIVFDGEDFDAKRAAVEAGQGLTALPSRVVPPSLMRAREYYLPELPKMRMTILSAGDPSDKQASLVAQLKALFIATDDDKPH